MKSCLFFKTLACKDHHLALMVFSPDIRRNILRGAALSGLCDWKVAGVTGLEPAASGVTGRRSNQLSYTP